MKSFILLLISTLLFNVASAQVDSVWVPARNCYLGHMSAINALTYSGPGQYKQEAEDSGEIYIIPVVVHVIHAGGPENLPDSIIKSQIDVLNEDFGRYGKGYNENPIGGDARIRFCLATTDLYGRPSTGILRVMDASKTDLKSDDEMRTKNASRWDRKHYLNIWIVRSIDGNSQVQGYSYLARDINNLRNPDADGVVIGYKYFGRNSTVSPADYKLGHTCSHEVGHWLNLRHPWGGDADGQGGCNDDDGIDDTPLCKDIFSARYRPLNQACDHPLQCGYIRLTEDYMDYSVDICMNMFTQGQINAMRQAVLQYRPEIIKRPNIYATGCEGKYKALNPATDNTLQIHGTISRDTFFLFPYFIEGMPADIVVHDPMGRLVKQKHFNVLFNNKETLELLGLAPGFYIISVVSGQNTYRQKVVLTGRQ